MLSLTCKLPFLLLLFSIILTYNPKFQIPYPLTLDVATSLWPCITSRDLLPFTVRSGPSEDHPLFLRPNANALVTATPPLPPNKPRKKKITAKVRSHGPITVPIQTRQQNFVRNYRYSALCNFLNKANNTMCRKQLGYHWHEFGSVRLGHSRACM